MILHVILSILSMGLYAYSAWKLFRTKKHLAKKDEHKRLLIFASILFFVGNLLLALILKWLS